MKRRLVQLLLGVFLAVLLPGVAGAQARGPVLGLHVAPPTGDERASVSAQLADPRGAPIGGATIRFYVDDAYDGQARTSAAGQANWRLRHRLGAGRYRITAVFEDGNLRVQAEQPLAIAAAQIAFSVTPSAPRVGEPLTVRARVTGVDGAPVPQARVLLFVGGVRRAELRANANGVAERVLKGDMPAGALLLAAEFPGAPGLLPARAELPLTIGPALLAVRTVPALAGVRFALDDRVFVSGGDGVARVQVLRPGTYSLAVLPWDRDDTGIRAQFDRWEDPVFEPVRTVTLPMRQPLAAGFDVSYLVTHDFVDPLGRSVDPGRITSFHFTSSYGTNYETTDFAPRWLRGIHVVRGQKGLTASSVAYAVESVMIDGANVVNQAQQRFATGPGERWRIHLQLYSARFVARDALFGIPSGTALSLTFPDGQVETRVLGADATATFQGLARGQYTVKLDAPGMAGITPAAISHDQEVRLLVLSYLDMAVIGGFLAMIALSLLLVGRPWLPSLLRDPLGLARQAGAGLRLAPARLRNTAAFWLARMRRQSPAAARARLARTDPVVLAAIALVSLGGLGSALGPGVAARAPLAVVPTATSQPLGADAPPDLPTPTPVPEPARATAQAADPLPPPALETPLARASGGAAVVHLQQRLRELGYFTYPDNTGFYGTLTVQAVGQFQRARGLAVTGEADAATLAAINACGSDCRAAEGEKSDR